jgi:phosphofructokinase-like protein
MTSSWPGSQSSRTEGRPSPGTLVVVTTPRLARAPDPGRPSMPRFDPMSEPTADRPGTLRVRRIALSTGGGDAPGLNAVIHAATLAARARGWDVVGIRDGFNGLLDPGAYPDGGVVPLDRPQVRGIAHLGGTMLGTTNRGNPMHYPIRLPDGGWGELDRTGDVVDALRARGIDALVSAGGDGSLAIAARLGEHGFPVVGVPKTIDNDLDRTVVTFGFETAVQFATDCIDRLFTTATSHGRLMVVEVMGRYAGWIALHAGMAAGAHVILIPEIPYDLDLVAEVIRRRDANRARSTVVVVAEGAAPVGGSVTVQATAVGQAERLGGVGEKVAHALEALTGKEARTVVLGHLLRGGSPVATDRLMGLRFGAAAVRALAAGVSGVMVAIDPPDVAYVPLAEATRRLKTVPLECDTMHTAHDIGISFGAPRPVR